jgi:molecular chaperone Hsp33
MGKLIRGTSKNARFYVVDSKDIVQKAQEIHGCSPTAIAAFGRLLTASLMMGADLKGNDLLTIRIDSDGPLSQIIVTADPKGDVKGYLSNPLADTAPKPDGHPDVSSLIGKGALRIIKDMGLKEPYVGLSTLQTGEIAEDLAYYYYTSEQIPTVIALGVSINDDLSVKAAGGYMVQLLPDAEDWFIDKLEEKIKSIRPVTELLEGGMDVQRIVKLLYEDIEDETYEKLVEDYKILDEKEPKYNCNCNKDKFYRGLITLGREQLEDLFSKEDKVETECHFCRTKYEFRKEDFSDILK